MESFKAFIEQQEFVEAVLREFDEGTVPSTQSGATQTAAVQPLQKQKPWSAKKPEILQMWRNLRADTPIIMTPLSDPSPMVQDRSTYGEDGIRVTGSWYFISAVLARLKELVNYENPGSKLRLIFRGIDKSRDARPDRQSYVFYVNLERRTHGKPGRPTTATPLGTP